MWDLGFPQYTLSCVQDNWVWYKYNMVSDPFSESRIESNTILQSGLGQTQHYKTSL